MTFRTEFPDFPEADIPAFPPGFEDTSWHNNTAPSFANREIGLSVWVDYADTSLREFEDMLRFVVHPINSDGEFIADDPVFASDDWAEVLAYIAKVSAR